MSDTVFVPKSGLGVWILAFLWLTVILLSCVFYRLRSLGIGICSTLAAVLLTVRFILNAFQPDYFYYTLYVSAHIIGFASN